MFTVWGSLSHVSWHADTFGFPIARAYSLSDGPLGESTGVPYLYMTLNDEEMLDIVVSKHIFCLTVATESCFVFSNV